MKQLVLALLVCCGSLLAQDATTRAVEGAQLLHSTMRDPDSFKVSRAWIMSTEKFSDVVVCYDYYSRNGYGGMNAGHAIYAPHSKKDMAKGKYILDTFDGTEEFIAVIVFADRCGAKAERHGFTAKDVTKEVTEALNHAE